MQKWARYWSFKKRLEEKKKNNKNNLNQYNNRKVFRWKRKTLIMHIRSVIYGNKESKYHWKATEWWLNGHWNVPAIQSTKWWRFVLCKHMYESSTCIYIYRIWCSQYVVFKYVSGIHSYSTYMNLITNLNFKEVDWLLCRLFGNTILIMYVSCNWTRQGRGVYPAFKWLWFLYLTNIHTCSIFLMKMLNVRFLDAFKEPLMGCQASQFHVKGPAPCRKGCA